MQNSTEARIKQEAARLQHILDERARRNAEEQAQIRAQRVQSTIRWFKQRIEDDNNPWTLHVCSKDLEGCAAGQLDRFCPEGQELIIANLRDRD